MQACHIFCRSERNWKEKCTSIYGSTSTTLDFVRWTRLGIMCSSIPDMSPKELYWFESLQEQHCCTVRTCCFYTNHVLTKMPGGSFDNNLQVQHLCIQNGCLPATEVQCHSNQPMWLVSEGHQFSLDIYWQPWIFSPMAAARGWPLARPCDQLQLCCLSSEESADAIH